MDRDDMYHACLLIHGPPPPKYAGTVGQTHIITTEFYNYRIAVQKWVHENFEMRGDSWIWFERYHNWAQEKIDER